ncbi:MAG: hypothetical protein GEV03_24700 [Streptosporangiales bacterium]|nr:hypothetical protein [Streptosporangiales bacterium]
MNKEHDIWVEDLEDLKRLAVYIEATGDELDNAVTWIPSLRMDPNTFGEGSDVGAELVRDYDSARDDLEGKVTESGDRTHKVADAVLAIVRHYEHVDRKLG